MSIRTHLNNTASSFGTHAWMLNAMQIRISALTKLDGERFLLNRPVGF
jgi:hypothetical protein